MVVMVSFSGISVAVNPSMRGGLAVLYRTTKNMLMEKRVTYINESCSHLRERILRQLCKDIVEAAIQGLFDLVRLNVLAKVICNQRMVDHLF